jgi:hypothetical protein
MRRETCLAAYNTKMPEIEAAKRRINASPTKEFFIFMLTRDVHLTRAIIDLVDNSVDGAHRLRSEGNYEGLWVRIELNKEVFRVTDNCGGIPIQIARDYAFRFGRPKEAEETPGSVGLFGVGMKRTFFKLGRWFSVDSKCSTERFKLSVDVDEWIAEGDEQGPEKWHFDFDMLEENIVPVEGEEIGTTIEVKSLLEPVAATFGLETFEQQLLSELKAAHAVSVERGLKITVNQIAVEFVGQTLLTSSSLYPAYVLKNYPRQTIDGRTGEPVRVRLYAGLNGRSLHEGGWYIFCNGRLIVMADQGSTTVWGKSHNMPQYHPDFAYFRGYAYLDSKHPVLLPWTTTKTGVDVDSGLYKTVQREMIELTKPVLKFLSELTRQRSGEDEGNWAESVFQGTTLVSTRDVQGPSPLRVPQPPAKMQGPSMQRIQYWAATERVDRAKTLLGVSSFKDVGERTFDYYMKYEGEE